MRSQMLSQLVSYLFFSTLTLVLAHPSTCPVRPFGTSSGYICSSPPNPYVITYSPGRGLGAFATHDLEVGSAILREAPVLRIARPDYVKGSGYPIAKVTKLLRRDFQHILPDEQAEVLGLTYHADPGELGKVDGDTLGLVFRTNAYNTGADFGLFPKIARINHSCAPNAAYYWNEKWNRRIVYATRAIREGEEIFVSYIPLIMSRDERRKRLSRYGFTCSCTTCALPPADLTLSDRRRENINLAFKAFESQLNLTIPNTASALRKARKNAASSLQLAELVDQESIADYLPMAWKIVAVSHARIGDWEQASVWANKAYEWRVREDASSIGTKEMFDLTERFIENWKRMLGS